MTVNPRLPEKNTALTPLRKLGYEAGITTESIVYNCFYIYFVIFLMNVVGLNPVMAGTVSLISVCVDAITDPILGWIVDHPKVNEEVHAGRRIAYRYPAHLYVCRCRWKSGL